MRRDEEVGPDEHRALVEAMPARLLPLVAAGLITAEEAQEMLRRARLELADRPDPD